MERKYILLINTDCGRFCYKGEGTKKQILQDIEKIDSPENLEVFPVIGGRFQKESLIAGSFLGIIITGIGVYIYENLYKRRRKARRISTSNKHNDN